MTINLNKAIASITQAMATYQSSLAAEKDLGLVQRAEGHQLVHERVAALYASARPIMADEALLAEVISHYSVSIRDGQNPWFAIVKCCCRKLKKDGGSEFNKSAGKYANSLRYFAESEWPEDEIVDRLRNFEASVDGRKLGGLKATEALDRAKHGDREEQEEFEKAAFADLREQESFSVPTSVFGVEGATDGMFIAPAFELVGDEWRFRYLTRANSASVRRGISKEVVSAFKRRLDTLLLELAQANDQTEALNQLSDEMRRLHARTEERRLAEEHPLDPDLFEEPATVASNDQTPEPALAAAG